MITYPDNLNPDDITDKEYELINGRLPFFKTGRPSEYSKTAYIKRHILSTQNQLLLETPT